MPITPAFSPGPWMTCGPLVGSPRRWILEDLYEQCSFHIAEKMPSSVMVGSRPISWRIRSYSSGLRPCSATSSGVMVGALGITCASCRLREMGDQPGEQPAPIGAADRVLHVVFRVRHQAEDVELLVEHARDPVGRAVDVPFRVALAVRIGVAEQYAPFRFEPADRAFAGEVIALAVRHRYADHLAGIVAARERRVGALDLQMHVAAEELHAGVAQQHAGQELGLAQNLEAVAHAHHQGALARVAAHRLHDRRMRGDRAAAQVIAIGEAAGQHDEVGACRKLAFAMPHHRGRAPRDELERPRHVALAIRSWEDDDGSFHDAAGSTGAATGVTSTRKFSITVLASSFSAASRSVVSARTASLSSISMSNTLPWRTLATPATPSDFSAPSIALPCGSRTPFFRVTVTRAFMALTSSSSKRGGGRSAPA